MIDSIMALRVWLMKANIPPADAIESITITTHRCYTENVRRALAATLDHAIGQCGERMDSSRCKDFKLLGIQCHIREVDRRKVKDRRSRDEVTGGRRSAWDLKPGTVTTRKFRSNRREA